jgi:predicted RNA methylase
MSDFLHNRPEEVVRFENEEFNKTWISKKGLKFQKTIDVSDLSVPEHDKCDASPFQVVWLKNIDRLMSLVNNDFQLENITLIDVGCGTGISTLYIADNYNFKKYIGFDFDVELIKKAELNRKLISLKNKRLEFIQKDARNYTIPNEKCILFMFNPFGLETMKIFIEKNLDLITKSHSIIAYANDVCIDYLDSLNTNIKRIKKFNLSLVTFN